jgi:DNA-binding response OmpR family regulator
MPRPRILVIDDEAAIRDSLRMTLEYEGYEFVGAATGQEGLALVERENFDLVLLDVKMPGMDGFETAALIHDHPRFETTPIIFVTGVHVTEFDRLKGYKAGGIDYVYIPVVPEILRSKVRRSASRLQFAHAL